MKIIKTSEIKKTPWKNGQGLTREIAVCPQQGDFIWRLSVADINGPNQFSIFKGYKRILVPWIGNGFLLNGKKINSFELYQFDGGENIHCDIDGAPVVDLGLIYKPDCVKVRAQILSNIPGEIIDVQAQGKSEIFIFCFEGNMRTEDSQMLNSGDALHIEPSRAVKLKIESKVMAIKLEIKYLD